MQSSTVICMTLTLLLAGACSKSVDRDEPITESAAVAAVFLPDTAEPCNSDLPFPTDLAKDPTTGRLNIPYCRDDDASATGLKTGLRTLDGYSFNATITVRFSGAINPDTVEGAVAVVDPQGQKLPFTFRFFTEMNNTLYIQPDQPLMEGTQYLVVVDNGIMDTKGQPVVADQVLIFAKSKTPLIDGKGYSKVAALDDATANGLEAFRQSFAPVFAKAEEVTGKDRKEIVSTFVFTTQTGYSALEGLSGLVALKGGAQVVHETSILAANHALVAAAGIPVTDVCAIHTGRITLPNLLTAAGTFGVDATGQPLTSTTTVDYLLMTPKTGTCDTIEPWALDKVVVFAHALGNCKNNALALGNSLAGAGYATLAIDGVRGGTRALDALGDQNLDACPDGPAIPELILIGAETPNPFGIRDRMRQWALELSALATKVRAAPWAFVGQTEPTTPPTTAVSMVGHSWGGIAALLAAPLGQGVDSVVVNAVPGEYGEIFTPLLAPGIAATMPGASQEEINAAVQYAVVNYRWALEPADALYSLSAYPSGMPVLLQVVSAGDADASLHGKSPQLKLAGAFAAVGKDSSTFLMADDENSATFCASATDSLASLLKPCTEDPANVQRALAAVGGMQRQLVTYIATGGTVVCDPDPTVACP